ncbi:MAG: hypothetical protein EOP05_19965, partial [Proteobacteria bacterium]
MGIIKQGVLGGFRKKTGSVVGAYWRRLDVIRALPRNSGKKPTQAQADHRLKFGLVTGFLSWISELIDIGFKGLGETITPMNKAVSFHLKEAVAGASPNFIFDVEALVFSLGKLALPSSMIVEAAAPVSVRFAWSGNDVEGKFNYTTDRATFLIYNVSQDRFVHVLNAVERSAHEYVLELPTEFAGSELKCFYCFNS